MGFEFYDLDILFKGSFNLSVLVGCVNVLQVNGGWAQLVLVRIVFWRTPHHVTAGRREI